MTRIILDKVVGWLLVAAGVLLTAHMAAAYSCGDPSSGHCYGTNSWSQDGEYFGAYSDITIATLSCPNGCGGFVDDELWLVDRTSRGCVGNSFKMCWVEAGYLAIENQGQVYFWADSRPLTSSTFNLHLLGGTDAAGTLDHFMIVKDGRVTPQTFQLFIYNDPQSTLYNGTSTVPSGTTPMAGHNILIGQELAGSKDASASTANFTRNIWAVQALGPEYVFWYSVQGAKGSVTSDSPPVGQWSIDPGSCGAVEGGEFTTHCCT